MLIVAFIFGGLFTVGLLGERKLYESAPAYVIRLVLVFALWPVLLTINVGAMFRRFL